ncbi:MAG: hypothetical protein A3H98_14245 [Bacteroidetes bacterium RIFCSPLOWO2_02_FULL_36_8]|nr:MAG: hypothetical protein A3H98_14245 [Bacteroidetes bacterium RIFCSPLOWO2_02_FULL_36_8]OFY69126.1 MAG: hypothetical protein A3G23_06145 [Bacteroidetes bacterium RIFCSPLOWO2_12_FULL_37_12]
MKQIISGNIDDNCPTLTAAISEKKCLVFTINGRLLFTVDSGFSGGVALPIELLSKLNIRFIGYENYSLADGTIIQLKEYYGIVEIGKEKVLTTFIEGDFLIGIEFMKSIADKLIVDFRKQKITLLRD